MLFLFLRLMARLRQQETPALHIEELSFSESVDRQTIIDCVQMFAPFVVTLRLPDPVAACFAGLEWPD